MLSDIIEIDYWGDIGEGQWIMIDDLKFFHVMNDSTADCKPDYIHNYQQVNGIQNDDRLYLPSTNYHKCSTEGERTVAKLTNGDMQANLLAALNEYADYDKGSLEPPYKNSLGSYLATIGKIRLERSNGEKIKISTSKNYKASIRTVVEKAY